MLKQSPSKNLRSKGFKVKHVLQIFLLLAICFWLFHQVKHCYEGKKAYEQSPGALIKVQNEHESLKLGRRELRFPIQQTILETQRQGDGGEFSVEANEMEEIKPENSMDEGRGGDDEIEGNDQEKSEEEDSEEVEDLIDEEDREREDETEEQEGQEAENQFEDETFFVNQVQYEGKSNSKTRENLYNGENTAGR